MSESGSGNPSSDSTAGDKELSCPDCGKIYASSNGLRHHLNSGNVDCTGFECPSCDENLRSKRGVKLHHKRSHGESIRGVESECEECGEVYRVSKSQTRRSRFCSRECKDNHQTISLKGVNNPNHSRRVEVECSWCGVREKVPPSRVERYAYCSRKCKNASMVGQTGEDHPRWQEKETLECEVCESEFEVYPNHYHPARFCGQACYGKWLSENNSGEDNPCWKGGSRPYYGPNWHRQRRKALDRDDHTCQDCGSVERLHVHHIRPIREFDEPKRANVLINLVTLCASCHRKWEGLYLRPDPR